MTAVLLWHMEKICCDIMASNTIQISHQILIAIKKYLGDMAPWTITRTVLIEVLRYVINWFLYKNIQ